MRKLLFLPRQGATYAAQVDHLHYFVLLTTLAVAAALTVTGLAFFVRYKQRVPGKRGTRAGQGLLLEVLFIGTPLSFFLLWLGMGIDVYLHIVSPPADAMQVYVTAKQWMWKFDYPDGPVAQGVLHVPVGRPVKLLMTSRDVIHSFYVPAFRAKRDVLPGRYTEYWFQATAPGHYDIFCAEYCGAGHSYMRGQVIALPPAQFHAWYAAHSRGRTAQDDANDPAVGNSLVAQGERVAANQGCLKCHSVDGSAHIGPTWLGLFGRREVMTDGTALIADAPYLTESMMAPAARIVRGYQPVMPSFQGRLAAPEVAALLEYIKSLHDLPLQVHPPEGPTYEPR